MAPRIVDLGRVLQNEVKEFDLYLENKGGQDAKIAATRFDCACLALVKELVAYSVRSL